MFTSPLAGEPYLLFRSYCYSDLTVVWDEESVVGHCGTGPSGLQKHTCIMSAIICLHSKNFGLIHVLMCGLGVLLYCHQCFLYLELLKHVKRNVSRYHSHATLVRWNPPLSIFWHSGCGHCDKCSRAAGQMR